MLWSLDMGTYCWWDKNLCWFWGEGELTGRENVAYFVCWVFSVPQRSFFLFLFYGEPFTLSSNWIVPSCPKCHAESDSKLHFPRRALKCPYVKEVKSCQCHFLWIRHDILQKHRVWCFLYGWHTNKTFGWVWSFGCFLEKVRDAPKERNMRPVFFSVSGLQFSLTYAWGTPVRFWAFFLEFRI